MFVTPFALLACHVEAPAPAPVESDTGDAEEALPYIVDDTGTAPGALSEAEVEASLQAALTTALALTAEPVLAGYHAAFTGTEDGCPDYYDYEGSEYWYDACTSAAGTSFSGYGFYYLYNAYDQGDGTVLDGEALSGVATIETLDGFTYEFGGNAYDVTITPTDGSYLGWYTAVQGGFSWNGPEAAGTWLEGADGADMVQYAYTYPDYGNIRYLDGSVEVADQPASNAVFDLLVLWPESLSPDCREPGGTISLRDDEGQWYDVAFDGWSEYDDAVDLAKCDGCGTIWVDGEAQGLACADFEPMLAFEGKPW